MKHWVEVSNIQLYAYHGCMQEERMIGSDYRVDVKVETNFESAAESDDLKDAVDYVSLYQIVEREMAVPANLLENVAMRIYRSIHKDFPSLKGIAVKIAKKTPPINGNVEEVVVSMGDFEI